MSYEDADINGWNTVFTVFGRAIKVTKYTLLVTLGLICLASFGAGLHAGLFG